MQALVLTDNNGCHKVNLDFSGTAIEIRSPVGELEGGFGNQDSDVRIVQSAVNSIPVSEGGRRGGVPLKVDGICLGKTKAAIREYQTKRFGGADGRVDPGGRTARQMYLDLHPNDSPDEELVKTIITLVPQARLIIKGALVKLSFAESAFRRTGGGLLSGLQQDAMAIVNRHFSLDKFADWGPEFARIKHLFETMDLVVARGYDNPLAQWQGVFMPNTAKSMDASGAYTYPGGYYHKGGIDPDSFTHTKTSPDLIEIFPGMKPFPQRYDRIYICRGLAKDCSDYQAMAIVHELSHFVGGGYASPNMIDDHAYGWVENPKMQRLLPWWRTRNAQSFANFAFESTYGHKPSGLQ